MRTGSGKILKAAKKLTKNQIIVSAITTFSRFLSANVRLQPLSNPLQPLFSTAKRFSPVSPLVKGANSDGKETSPAVE
jgi:hypothetical protein